MRSTFQLAVVLAAGVALGAGAVQSVRAQAKPPAYVVVAFNEVFDAAGLATVNQRAAPVVAAHGGQFIIRSPEPSQLSGETPKRFALIRFDSAEKARSWYNSAAMKPISELRDKSTKASIFLVDGVSN
jgi:uncharacterized protein (DUF1330 family)